MKSTFVTLAVMYYDPEVGDSTAVSSSGHRF